MRKKKYTVKMGQYGANRHDDDDGGRDDGVELECEIRGEKCKWIVVRVDGRIGQQLLILRSWRTCWIDTKLSISFNHF